MPELEEYWRAMRAIMYQPTAVWLVTSRQTSRRWLTDQFVMLDVTDAEEFRELPDGAYKLTVGKGPEPREAPVDFDIDTYFEKLDERVWWEATPTMWSVVEEYQGKAQLWRVAVEDPALLGEPTWSAIKRFYPDCRAEYAFDGNGLFRFSVLPAHVHDDDGSVEGCPGCFFSDPITFAYAAPIKMPEGQENMANAIVEAA